ncbi:uncharacterized protein BKA55DRAFT_548141 [Fusarium redolens]|uniref:Uncharacterized protein n=1 Tax=Fusarium redolens TaxID=48865 RepID=A0A9P9KVQ6_FUSRE|nr:uncharacterized protein BKA55DRAFT_548141 [Fusarium redolens]KAH7269255.1 hypothetical protein BKA55DRAFT_548141 [Fusarium redolens]
MRAWTSSHPFRSRPPPRTACMSHKAHLLVQQINSVINLYCLYPRSFSQLLSTLPYPQPKHHLEIRKQFLLSLAKTTLIEPFPYNLSQTEILSPNQYK